MLQAPRSALIGVSSTAPLYSLAVTIGLITPLVGAWAPLALVLAALPMLLVVRTMTVLDDRWRDQGTVYRWAAEHLGRVPGLLGGWLLAWSGVVVMASLAQVAAESALTLAGIDSPVAAVLLGLAVLAGLGALSARGIEQGMAVQYATAAIQLVGVLVAVGILLAHGAQAPAPVAAGPAEWVHAVLLALFIYWGWDSTYALTEESGPGVAGRAATVSMVALVALYVVLAWAYATTGASAFPQHPVVDAALCCSALAACHNTVIPTSRGLLSMARRGDLPRSLDRLAESTWLTTAAAALYLVVMVAAGRGFFDDTIESVAIFVAGYYALACLAGVRAARTPGERAVAVAGSVLMLAAGAVTAVEIVDPDYGATSFAGVSTVAWFAGGAFVVFAVLVAGSAVWRRRRA